MLRNLDKQKRLGSTLTEVFVVMALIGSMAAIAFPRLANQIRIMRNDEAKTILYALYQAQKDYYDDHGQYTQVMNQLDIEIPRRTDYFSELHVYQSWKLKCPAVLGGTDTDMQVVAAMRRDDEDDDKDYYLLMSDKGEMQCWICGIPICTKQGYDPW